MPSRQEDILHSSAISIKNKIFIISFMPNCLLVLVNTYFTFTVNKNFVFVDIIF